MSACEMCYWDPDRVITASWTITAPGLLYSQNYVGANTPRNYKYRKIKSAFDKALSKQLNEIPRANRFRAGIITRYYNTCKPDNYRAYDLENFVGGQKPLIDVLKGYAVIVNDSPSWWRGYYLQEKHATNHYTIQLLEFARPGS